MVRRSRWRVRRRWRWMVPGRGRGRSRCRIVTGRPVRARVLVLPGAGADASWFQVVGESERALPVAGTATVDVAVKVPEKAPAGSFSFAVGAALEEAPDQVVSGSDGRVPGARAQEAEVPVVDPDRRGGGAAAARRRRHPDLEPHPPRPAAQPQRQPDRHRTADPADRQDSCFDTVDARRRPGPRRR